MPEKPAMAQHVDTIGTIFIACCAIVVAVHVIHSEWTAFRHEPKHLKTEEVKDWQPYAVGRHVGPANALVTITEFFDYQCPFCKQIERRIDEMRIKYGKNIRVVFNNLPIPGHDYAFSAAVAAECAGNQGRFEEYHEALFDHQQDLGTISWTAFADSAHVPDIQRFAHCVQDTLPKNDIERTVTLSRKLAITGTPALLINGYLIRGSVPVETLEVYIDRALGQPYQKKVALNLNSGL